MLVLSSLDSMPGNGMDMLLSVPWGQPPPLAVVDGQPVVLEAESWGATLSFRRGSLVAWSGGWSHFPNWPNVDIPPESVLHTESPTSPYFFGYESSEEGELIANATINSAGHMEMSECFIDYPPPGE